MSKVLRPNRNALAWLLSSVTNSPTAGSGNGAWLLRKQRTTSMSVLD
jgi:hypothetical protein